MTSWQQNNDDSTLPNKILACNLGSTLDTYQNVFSGPTKTLRFFEILKQGGWTEEVLSNSYLLANYFSFSVSYY